MSPVLVLCLLTLRLAYSKLVTFSNTAPRLDTGGAILNAHDGTTRRYSPNAPFFYHAIGYPACNETGAINGCNSCIFSRNNSIDVWSSPDLSSGSWSKVYTAYPNPAAAFPQCTYFRSQVIYSAATQRYVLWVNAVGCVAATCPGGKCLDYATATAPAPEGPFTFAGMAQPASLPSALGDFALLADSDGTAYAVLCHLLHGAGPRDMYVLPLTADFLHFQDVPGVLLPGPKLVEAPAFFRQGATYTVLLGGCTCMGLWGGGVAALTAPHPLGPWTATSSQLDPGCNMDRQSTCFEMGPGAVCNPVTQAQQNFVMQVPLATGGWALVWTGDRWQQAPNKMYDQQPQTWLPLMVNNDTGVPLQLQYVQQFTLDVEV
jgi:hypothetical protein